MSKIDDTEAPADAAPATPAATVVVFRHDPMGGPAQVLLVERASTMVFAGGATVFPGGKVDPADRVLAKRHGGADDLDDVAGRIAAIRETLEETGLVIGVAQTVSASEAQQARRKMISCGELGQVLASFGWTLALDSLVPFARWWPRHRPARVFDTRFYLADLGTGAVEVAADATENRHLFWASAAEALRLADKGAISVIFPTRRNLERLAQFNDFESCRQHALVTPQMTIAPQIEHRDGEPWLVIPDGAGYPVTGEPLALARRG